MALNGVLNVNLNVVSNVMLHVVSHVVFFQQGLSISSPPNVTGEYNTTQFGTVHTDAFDNICGTFKFQKNAQAICSVLVVPSDETWCEVNSILVEPVDFASLLPCVKSYNVGVLCKFCKSATRLSACNRWRLRRSPAGAGLARLFPNHRVLFSKVGFQQL
jgi:hypothetical protein